MPAQRELFERKNARLAPEWIESLRQVDVKIQVKAAEAIDGQIAEEVNALDRELKSAKCVAVFREVPGYKARNGRVVEKAILVIGMQGSSARRGRSTCERQLARRCFRGLNDPLRNSAGVHVLKQSSTAPQTCERIASQVHFSRNCCHARSANAAAAAGSRIARTQ